MQTNFNRPRNINKILCIYVYEGVHYAYSNDANMTKPFAGKNPRMIGPKRREGLTHKIYDSNPFNSETQIEINKKLRKRSKASIENCYRFLLIIYSCGKISKIIL